jgi:hypothetical protein
LLLPGQALAQSTFSEGAAAEALFREGAKRFDEGELAEACEKFAASHQLEPAPGTALRLGDCYDRIGKTASAWAAFEAAAALARASQQTDREEIATERSDELFSRLSYLSIEVARSTRSLDGVQVLLDGREIPSGTWGTPIPIDPGPQSVTVRAPGHQEWKAEVEIQREPGEQSLEVPELVPLERDSEPGPVARGEQREQASAMQESDDRMERSGTQRVLAYVAGGLGLAGLGAGGYFTSRAYKLNQQSLSECLVDDANACTSRGKALRDDARRQGNFATVAAGAGFALVGVSVVLLLTEPDEARVGSSGEVRLLSGVGASGPSVALEGTW